jgi:hypothetical protein
LQKGIADEKRFQGVDIFNVEKRFLEVPVPFIL